MIEPNYSFARNMARKLIKKYKLSEVPTNLVEIFESLGLEYIELNDPEDIDGAILEIEGKPKIAVLNRSKPIQRQRFTLAHELGHIFLEHKKRDIYDADASRENLEEFQDVERKPPKEVEADVFASELLIPYEQLKKHQEEINRIDKLAGIFQVSKQAMTLAVLNFRKYLKSARTSE
jgi:Zn-dependent peptidase ImmA (M78 family)